MKKTLLFLILILVHINVQANNFEKFYQPREGVVLAQPIYLKPNEQPEIHTTFNWEDFHLIRESWESKGYTSIGNSIFSDYKISEKLALAQAKKIKATQVLTLTEVTNDSLPYTNGEDLNKLNWAYKYIAVYAVKDNIVSNYKLGIQVRDLNSKEKKTFQRNTGNLVAVVYENTRAYMANILKDDVITHINQVPVRRYEEFVHIRDDELKKTNIINFSILRLVNGQVKEITIPVNFDN